MALDRIHRKFINEKIPSHIEKEIVRRYTDGEVSSTIAIDIGISYGTVTRIVKRTGGYVRSQFENYRTCVKWKKGWKLSPEQKEEIILLYSQGMKYRELAERFNVSDSAIWGALKRRKVKTIRRELTEEEISYAENKADSLRVTHVINPRVFLPLMRRHLGKSVNENAFAIINQEEAYWLGILMSDGNVFGNTITLQLSGEDTEHVIRFKDFIKSSHAVSTIPEGITSQGCKRKKAFHFQFVSNQITSDLKYFGIVPAKSVTAKVIHIEKHPDFWRGMIDGDGCINLRKRDNAIKLSLVGSATIVNQFSDFIREIYPEIKYKIHDIKNNRAKMISMNGKNTYIILKVLYKENCISLPRKFNLAIEAMNRFHKSYYKSDV